MTYGQLFAFIMILLSAAAALAYLADGDYKHALYWTLAAGITATVTWM